MKKLPKFIQLAREGQARFSLSKWLPAISAMTAALCWGIAFYFSYFSGNHEKETAKQNLNVE